MRIGIDLDEVIMDTLSQVIKYYNRRYKTSFTLSDFHSYNWWETWGCTKDKAIRTWLDFNNSDVSRKIKPIERAISSINFLAKTNEIIIITSRQNKVKEQTQKWLNKHFKSPPRLILTNDIYIATESKSKICKDLGIKLMIEDHPKYAAECAKSGIKTILFDKPWNKSVSHKEIVKVKNWPEALEVINALTQKG